MKTSCDLLTPVGCSVTACQEKLCAQRLGVVWREVLGRAPPAASDSGRAELFLKDCSCCWPLTKHSQPGKTVELLKLHYEKLSAREGAQRLALFSQRAEVSCCHHLGHGTGTTAATARSVLTLSSAAQLQPAQLNTQGECYQTNKNPNNKEKRQNECLSGKQPIQDCSEVAHFGRNALSCCWTIIHSGLGLALPNDTSVFNYT